MSDDNVQETLPYDPSLRRRRHNVYTAEEISTLNNDPNHYDLAQTTIPCPPLTGPHRQTVRCYSDVTNEPCNILLVEDTDEMTVTIETAVVSIMENEPVSSNAENNDIEVVSDEQEEEQRWKYGSLMPANKQEEVIKAARTLFSKRTRTLYNWLSPGILPSQLKASVSAAWDRLPDVEKEFYISQVLGKFGEPSTRTMVNPLIESFNSTPTLAKRTRTTKNKHNTTVNSMSKPKRRRLHRSPSSAAGSSSKTDDSAQTKEEEEDKVMVQQIRDDPLDEFVDDPELQQEFEQFRWTLYVSNVD